MGRFAARLEVVSNVAIIVLAVIVGAVVLRNYVFPPQPAPRPGMELPQGTRLELPGVQWSERPQTLVMVLRTDCQFCSASASFYRRLLEETTRLHVPVIAALPGEPAESQEYLRHIGIAVPDVRNVSLNSLGVGATPTLVLVDARGAVERSWVGKLPAAREADVLRSLQP